MFRWIWSTSVWLVFACDHPVEHMAAARPIRDSVQQYPTVLPQPLIDYLTVHLPQWRLVGKSDYSKTWWSFYDSSSNPCWARTDINDDRLADYACLLKKDSLVQLVICLGTSSHSFVHYNITFLQAYDTKEPRLLHGVAVAPPARIDVAVPRLQSLILRSNGFALLELEQRSCLYYSQNDRLQTFNMK
ncbi:hypothetical protein [Longitalea arenae]|uniref:hypothetical protein n=1 Tax=Longitalea arenae TaxID=2812558 RepID=UPI00196726F7|nr:hypothetical protein [Longitalea arenae]